MNVEHERVERLLDLSPRQVRLGMKQDWRDHPGCDFCGKWKKPSHTCYPSWPWRRGSESWKRCRRLQWRRR